MLPNCSSGGLARYERCNSVRCDTVLPDTQVLLGNGVIVYSVYPQDRVLTGSIYQEVKEISIFVYSIYFSDIFTLSSHHRHQARYRGRGRPRMVTSNKTVVILKESAARYRPVLTAADIYHLYCPNSIPEVRGRMSYKSF